MKRYQARWVQADTLAPRANVTFDAKDDEAAIRAADVIDLEAQSRRSPRTIHEGARLVQQSATRETPA